MNHQAITQATKMNRDSHESGNPVTLLCYRKLTVGTKTLGFRVRGNDDVENGGGTVANNGAVTAA